MEIPGIFFLSDTSWIRYCFVLVTPESSVKCILRFYPRVCVCVGGDNNNSSIEYFDISMEGTVSDNITTAAAVNIDDCVWYYLWKYRY